MHGGYWWPLGLANLAALVAARLAIRRGARRRAAASLLAGLAAAALWDDLGHGKRWFRRSLLPRKPTWNVVWLPGLVLLTLVTCLGVGLWLSALNVQFRDVRYTVPFLTQFWLFATPVAYPSSLLPVPWRTLYGLNPMAGVVEGFRWALLGTNTAPGPILMVSSAAALTLLVSGLFYFRRMERRFADIV